MGKIQTQVAAVVQMIDVIDGMPVPSGLIEAKTKQGYPLHRRDTGYFILLREKGMSVVDLVATSPLFEEASAQIDVRANEEVQRIFLKPKRERMESVRAVGLTGKCRKKAAYIAIPEAAPGMRLTEDRKAGDLQIMVDKKERIFFEKYMLCANEKQEIVKSIDYHNGIILLSDPLKQEYPKRSTRVCPLRPVAPDEAGMLTVHVQNITETRPEGYLFDAQCRLLSSIRLTMTS